MVGIFSFKITIKMKIRKYEHKDLPDVVRINTNCWKNNYEWIIDQDYLDSISYEEKLEKWSKNPQIGNKWIALVAEDKWKVVGFVHWWESRDKDTNSDINEIFAIYIDTNCQWLWVWQKLFNEFIKTTGRKEFYLRTLKENTQSTWFYKKMWWVEFKEQDYEFGWKTCKLVAYKWNIKN